jgi:hypothetical protein
MLHIIPRSGEGDESRGGSGKLDRWLDSPILWWGFVPLLYLIGYITDWDNNSTPTLSIFLVSLLLGPVAFFILIIVPFLVARECHQVLQPLYFFIFDRNEYINQKNRREKWKLQEAKRERNRIVRERRIYAKEQSELERKWKEKTGKRDPLLRELAENIFSDIRDYDIWFSGANPHRLKIEVFVNGDIREFTYGDIYHRDIEDIEREMKADKISPKPRPRYRSSRYYDGASDVGDSGSDLGDTMDE